MTEKFTVKGSWRIPAIDRWFYGELSFDPETGGKLVLIDNEVFAAFANDPNKIIIGESSTGELYTLIDYSRAGSSGSAVQYSINIIIKGSHIKSKEKLNFLKAKFELLNSDRWFGREGIELEDLQDGFNLKYRYPSEILFTTEHYDGEVRFTIKRNSSRSDHQILLKQQTNYSLKYKSPKNIHEILNDVMRLTEYITLMAFQQSYPIKIVLEDCTDSNRLTTNLVFFRQSFYRNYLADNWFKPHLIDFGNSSFDFRESVAKWCNFYKNNVYLVNCALSIFKNPSSFSEDLFMNVVRSVEALNRKIENSARNEKLRNRIIKMIEKLIKNNDAGKLPDFFIAYGISSKDGIDKYVKRVVNTRNYHAHLDRKVNNEILEGVDLYYGTMVLLTVLLSNILLEIGIKEEVFMSNWTNVLGYKPSEANRMI